MAQEDTNLAIKDAEGVSENDREGKFFSVFQIVVRLGKLLSKKTITAPPQPPSCHPTSATRTLKMSWRIVIALMFASAAMAQEDTNLVSKDAEGVSENDREGKFFSVFQIVKFKNGMCTTSTGDAGTCYTEAECAAAGGTASGPCASSFGVCCMFVANTCGSTVNQNNSYIQSPNYPAASSTG